MISWVAGILAAGLAWVFNVLVVRRWGDFGVVWLVPGFEEIVKTGAAVFLGASVPLVHGVFGLVEAVHDYVASRRLGLWSGLVSLSSHWFFGYVTFLVFRYTGAWTVAVLTAVVFHIFLNYLMIHLLRLRPR